MPRFMSMCCVSLSLLPAIRFRVQAPVCTDSGYNRGSSSLLDGSAGLVVMWSNGFHTEIIRNRYSGIYCSLQSFWLACLRLKTLACGTMSKSAISSLSFPSGNWYLTSYECGKCHIATSRRHALSHA